MDGSPPFKPNPAKKRRVSRRSRRETGGENEDTQEMRPLGEFNHFIPPPLGSLARIEQQLVMEGVEVDAVPITVSVPRRISPSPAAGAMQQLQAVAGPSSSRRHEPVVVPMQVIVGQGDQVPIPPPVDEAGVDIVFLGIGAPPEAMDVMIPAVLEVARQHAEVGGGEGGQQLQILPPPPQNLQLVNGRPDDQGWQESRKLLNERSEFLLNNPRMSDIKFVVGEAKVQMYGHKTILAMGSPVFEAQFFGSFKSTEEVIELPDFEPDTFLLFLKYLYTDNLEEPIDNVKILNLLRPAKKYIVPHLIERCSDILMSELKPENASLIFQVHNYADFFDLPKLGGACLRFIDRESEAIVQTEEFTMLNRETLASFLMRDGLNISELDLFKAILRWAEFECERNNIEPTDVNIRESIGDNMFHIRFPTMTAEEFATEVAPRNILTAEEARSIFIYMCTGYHNRMNPMFIPRFPVKKRGFYPQQYLINRFGEEPVPHSLNYRSGEIYTYRFNIKSDRQIFFKGVNIFSIKCGVHAQYADQRRFNGAVYLYECDTTAGDRDLAREKGRKQFSRDGSLESEFETSSGSRFFPVLFDNEVRIPANQTFTVCAVVSVASSSYQQQPLNTFMGTDEQTEVSVRCAEDLIVNFTFSHCGGEASVGKYTQSQIPEIVFSL